MTKQNNPFSIPDINKLNDQNNMFFPKNLNNNGNNTNIFPFPNNTGINNQKSFANVKNQPNTTVNNNNNNNFNPFLNIQDPFKKNPLSNQSSSLNTKPDEKNKTIFQFFSKDDKTMKNENKGNIFGSNNFNNINNKDVNPFLFPSKSQTTISPNFSQTTDKQP